MTIVKILCYETVCSILHMFYDFVKAAYHFTMRNHLPGPSSSHRQSCPSRSVAGTSPARVVSTECTEPVSSPASSPLTAQQATAVTGRLAQFLLFSPMKVTCCLDLPYVISLSAPNTLSEQRTVCPLLPGVEAWSPRSPAWLRPVRGWSCRCC